MLWKQALALSELLQASELKVLFYFSPSPPIDVDLEDVKERFSQQVFNFISLLTPSYSSGVYQCYSFPHKDE